MKVTISLLVLALFLAGCGETPPEKVPANGAAVVEAAPTPFAEGTYDVGCIGCIFGDPDATSCQTAVKVGDALYPLLGEGVPNAHTTGLCDHGKKAIVAGTLKDGAVQVTKFELVE